MDEQSQNPTPQIPVTPSSPNTQTSVPIPQPTSSGGPTEDKGKTVNLVVAILSLLSCWFFPISVPLAIFVLVRTKKGDKIRRLAIISIIASVLLFMLAVNAMRITSREKGTGGQTPSSKTDKTTLNIESSADGYKAYSNKCYNTKIAAPGKVIYFSNECSSFFLSGTSTMSYAETSISDKNASDALKEWMIRQQKTVDDEYNKYKDMYPDYKKFNYEFVVNKDDKINGMAAESATYINDGNLRKKVYVINLPEKKDNIASILILAYNGNPVTDPQFTGSSKVFIDNFTLN